MNKPKHRHFYWVKLKPYDKVVPGWEPMQRFHRKWCRTGVIYNFLDSEVEEIGPELTYERPERRVP